MKALVTGAAGFIGSHIAERLLQDGEHVVLVDDLSTGSPDTLKALLQYKNSCFYQVDIRHLPVLEPCFAGVDRVFHLAGRADIVPSIEEPIDYFSVNVSGTLNVLEAARRHAVRRFIYAASSSCYGCNPPLPTPEDAPICPAYPYALTKRLGEELVLHWGRVYRLPVVSLRLFNVYGPRSRTSGAYGAVLGVFLAQKWQGLPFTVIGDGEQSRDFTYVSDVARAFILAADSNLSHEVLNVGSGGHYTINRLVALLGGDTVSLPKRPGEPDCTFADIAKIRRLLSWQPQISLEQGVATLLARLDDWRHAPLWTPQAIAQASQAWFTHLGGALCR